MSIARSSGLRRRQSDIAGSDPRNNLERSRRSPSGSEVQLFLLRGKKLYNISQRGEEDKVTSTGSTRATYSRHISTSPLAKCRPKPKHPSIHPLQSKQKPHSNHPHPLQISRSSPTGLSWPHCLHQKTSHSTSYCPTRSSPSPTSGRRHCVRSTSIFSARCRWRRRRASPSAARR